MLTKDENYQNSKEYKKMTNLKPKGKGEGKAKIGKNSCGGIYSTGKCFLTKEDIKKFKLNIKAKRVVCVSHGNIYGECNMNLKEL